MTFNDKIKEKITKRRRLGQRGLLPRAVKSRQWLLGSVYTFTAAYIYTDLMDLSNGEDDQGTFTWTQNKGYDFLIPEHYSSIYVSSSTSNSRYELPGGDLITESEWLWAPWSFNYDRYNALYDRARNRAVGKIWVRNLSAGANQKVTFVVMGKYQSGAQGGAAS